MSIAYALIAILGLAILMVVHEGGHYLAARRFGMRVTKFSIGFGPTLWRYKPKDSPTTFQVALIPFLAYVQIAGMNPYEEADPNDAESYANASLWGRVVTIAAGPLANYFFASILMFFAFLIGGNYVADETSMRVHVQADGPAAKAGILDGDRILAIDGQSVSDWDQLKKQVSSHSGATLDVDLERLREGVTSRVHVVATPLADGEHKGKILVGPYGHIEPVTVSEAALLSVKRPPMVVYDLVRSLGRMIALKDKPQLAGPVGIVREVGNAARDGIYPYLMFLGGLSAYLGGFNLLPFPALDGGRLLFLGFEAASRRKADAKIEAKVHAIGLLMFLTLIAIVTYTEIMPSRKATTEESVTPR